MAGFLHGVEVIEIDSGPRPIRTISTGVIGIVGTAPGADPEAFPLNTPVLIAGSRREAAALDVTVDSTGGGTLPGALDGIFDQAGAVVICVRVDEGVDEGETMANIIGGVNATNGQLEGVHALVGAESVVGHAPRILCAPGWTHQRPEDEGNPGTYFANPVVAELEGIADRIAAVIIADGPNTTDAAAQLYAGDWGTSSRIYVIDPWVKVLNAAGDIVDEPASARVAGVIARTDNDDGFWVSPSNKGIFGIIGTSRPVDFKLGDISSRANLLNENDVATIIRQDGYRLWGNRVPTADPKWQFLCVRRTADVLNESIQRSHMWAVDRGITKTYLEDVVEGVNGFIANLVAQGAILGGECWSDPDLNNAASVQNGQVWFNFDFTPVYPAERVTFRSHLVNDYIKEALG
ncbi:phage tail sheath C-terminal domain-containing protein [Phaeobacter sp. CAU 1743]|uniref:phage tail sheath C-terminal domain-containing protein n=1 Tax=Phaeobacter sp. CAU 1743 TaxID=3140367 RepID=UPI0023B6BBC7